MTDQQKKKTKQNVINLKFRFVELFYKLCLNNDNIFTVLNKKKYRINETNVARTRKKLELFKRLEIDIKNEDDQKMINVVKNVFFNHNVQHYERKMLDYFFRTQEFLISK